MILPPLPDEVGGRLPRPALAPLVRRLDAVGIVEHARGAVPDASFGHCSDDAGRALALAVHHPRDPASGTIANRCLAQLDRSLRPDGHFVTRLGEHGAPTDDPPSDDAAARAWWGLATAAVNRSDPALARAAWSVVRRARPIESAHPRAAAHAVLAGVELTSQDHTRETGCRLVEANIGHIRRTPTSAAWPWPEPRLTYGNALLTEAILAAGRVLDDDGMIADGLELIDWLVAHEWDPAAGHFSFTPVGGRSPDDGRGFDQQPIEAWTIASACRRAFDLTGDPGWRDAIAWAAAWFDGENDVGTPVWDRRTGASFDGLTPTGPNLNQGTESTLAFIGTMSAYHETLGPCPAGQRARSSSR